MLVLLLACCVVPPYLVLLLWMVAALPVEVFAAVLFVILLCVGSFAVAVLLCSVAYVVACFIACFIACLCPPEENMRWRWSSRQIND
jgi:hypothetical protein